MKELENGIHYTFLKWKLLHPIEFRYGTPEMKNIWESENKLQRMLDVESAETPLISVEVFFRFCF